MSESPERPRLLIADDDPVIQTMYGAALAHEFEVIAVAPDSERAVAVAAEQRPDAALVDVDMPKGGGMAAVEGILRVSPATAIVVLSGDESDGVVRELMQAGAVAYRRKGVTPREIAQCLNEAIAAHAASPPSSSG